MNSWIRDFLKLELILCGLRHAVEAVMLPCCKMRSPFVSFTHSSRIRQTFFWVWFWFLGRCVLVVRIPS